MGHDSNSGELDKTATTKKKRIRRDRTEEILVEATRLFAEYGFQGTTLSMVAKAVGLTEPGVLHYFPSKVHLLQGVLAYRDQTEAQKYAGLVEAEKKDIEELLELVEDVYVEYEMVPELIQLFIVLVGESIYSEHPSHQFFVDRYRGGREIYVKELSRLTEKKIPSDIDLDELATLIMAVMDGLYIQWLLDPEEVDLVETFKLFSKILVGSLKG